MKDNVRLKCARFASCLPEKKLQQWWVKWKTAHRPCKVYCWLGDFIVCSCPCTFESSHFWIPPRQKLALSLSVANCFLIESPQVVYLFVEVKRKWIGPHMLLFFSSPFCHLSVSSRKQCSQSISVILCLSLVFTPLLSPASMLLCHAVRLCQPLESISPWTAAKIHPHTICTHTSDLKLTQKSI